MRVSFQDFIFPHSLLTPVSRLNTQASFSMVPTLDVARPQEHLNKASGVPKSV